MSTAITTSKVSARDRLAFTLFLSVALNVVIIVGITFDMTDLLKEKSPPPTLEVILVEKSSAEAEEEAAFLAQFAQSGAGNTQDRSRPSTMKAAPDMPLPFDGDSNVLQPEQTQNTVIQTQQDVLTQHQNDQQVFVLDEPDKQKARETTSAELIMRGREIARLSAEIQESMEIYSKRTKHRYISASTKAFRDAAYLDAWRRKIERIGNLNYPEEAKRKNLSGSLVLDVSINVDGRVGDISILKSSGHKLLDDAASRIVRLASPFAPLPAEMRKDTDILHITRTWQFLSGNRLSTK